MHSLAFPSCQQILPEKYSSASKGNWQHVVPQFAGALFGAVCQQLKQPHHCVTLQQYGHSHARRHVADGPRATCVSYPAMWNSSYVLTCAHVCGVCMRKQA
eukprot:5109923-Pyramimonas_sp.AAC.1